MPLVVLVLGLTRCEDSAYILATAQACLEIGADVLCLNLRGVGPSLGRTQVRDHAGRSEGLHAVLTALASEFAERGLLIVGYSLGGKMVLKFLTELNGRLPIRATISVSAPNDPPATARRIGAPRNRLYQRWVLASMREEGLAIQSPRPGERRAIDSARSV